jgi:hypothetical protein
MASLASPDRRGWWATGAVGLVLAGVVGLRLGSVLPEVPNRHAPLYDAARRTMDDMDAADALRGPAPWTYAVHLLGRQTWPTLRMALAAPVHALAGPPRALAVELGVSLAFTAALFLALACCARAYAGSTTGALGVLAIATPLLLENRDLLQQAVNGMLEVPEALWTLAAASAWMVSRDSRATRPWGTVVAGQLLFHTKFQVGLMFAVAVLVVEGLEAGGWRALPRVGGALVRELRRPTSIVLGIALALCAALAFQVVARGGLEGDSILGFHYSLRTARMPIWLSALTLFAVVQLAVWRARDSLRTLLSPRVRFFWAWLFTPMAAWLLVPYVWRLEVLLDSVRFDSHQAPSGGLWDRLTFYPRAAWEGWFAPGMGWLVPGLLGATGMAAWRSPFVRRLVVPFGAMAAVELALLVGLSQGNFQPRLTVNLAPLLALAAGAWVPVVPRPRLRAALAVGVSALLVAGAWPGWRRPALAATLSQGFEARENGDDCRGAASAFPLQHAVLINETAAARVQVCNLWVKLLARQRGADVWVRAHGTRPGPHEVLVLTERPEELGAREGLVPLDGPQQFGVLWGRTYRTADR